MSFLRNLYFFQGQKYTSFGKNKLHRQSASLGHSATGHSELGQFDDRLVLPYPVPPPTSPDQHLAIS